ncbi:MAG: hypothetical protein IPP56_14705 [Bacteroidetes bacterium]|nr:hypothetical protein [Bacteroidota bacterium]
MNDIDEINDFKDIEKSGKLNNELDMSNIYNVKIGGFGDVDFVRTYLTTLTIEELEKDVDVFETLSKDKNWPVSQIIQREVDKIRVSNISKDYVLKKERTVRYFPPIIIAILPRDQDESIASTLDYTKTIDLTIRDHIFEKSNFRNNIKLKEYFKSAEDLSIINGLYLLQVSKVFDLNILCWDKTKYNAIVIDGQHRLEALVHSKKQNPGIKNNHQDVVFLEFSQLIHKLEKETPPTVLTPVEVVRRVFVDINTNAKRVGIVRQVLMDDKDLASLLVQSLVDSENRDGTLKKEGSFLKSQLVDWYGESLKHTLPHITGILALHQILTDYLLDGSMSSIDDLRSPSKVKKWVRNLNQYFFVDKQIQPSEDTDYEITPLEVSLKEYTTQSSLDEEIYLDSMDVKETTLFVYDYRTLEIAQKSFEKMYLSSIVHFFEQFSPYKSAFEIVKENKGFDSISTVYKALLSSRKKIANSAILKDAIVKLRISMEDRLNQQYSLLLSVLGQKSLFNLLFKRIFQNFNNSYTEEIILNITKEFIKDINKIAGMGNKEMGYLFGFKEQFMVSKKSASYIDLGYVATQFWEGIIYEDGRIIYNTQGIKSFSSAIGYIIDLNNAIKDNQKLPEFNILFMEHRIRRILKKKGDKLDPAIEKDVKKIIKEKEKFIIDFLKKQNS